MLPPAASSIGFSPSDGATPSAPAFTPPMGTTVTPFLIPSYFAPSTVYLSISRPLKSYTQLFPPPLPSMTTNFTRLPS